jgi:hypothetical protein
MLKSVQKVAGEKLKSASPVNALALHGLQLQRASQEKNKK